VKRHKFSKVFFDANVILDIFDEKRKFHEASYKTLEYCIKRKIKILTSSDLVTTIYYVLRKIDKEKALNSIKAILTIFELIPFGNEEIEKALELMEKDKKYKDLEDTLQYVLAEKEGCDLIITNDKEFVADKIKKFSTYEFVKEFFV